MSFGGLLRVVGEAAVSYEDGYDTIDPESYPSCNCSNVGRQRPRSFLPVYISETKDGGTFYQFDAKNYDLIKAEVHGSIPSLFSHLNPFNW